MYVSLFICLFVSASSIIRFLGLKFLICSLALSAQSFVDLQFPNGQFTYVSGEGLSTSAFLPLCGGLLQAQGQYPGEMRFSFSRKVRLQIIQKIFANNCSTFIFSHCIQNEQCTMFFLLVGHCGLF